MLEVLARGRLRYFLATSYGDHVLRDAKVG